MSERLRRAVHEAERGDLRPQHNPRAAVTWQPLPGDLRAVEPVLIDRFLDLARPIADSRAGAGPEARLQDAGRFFYLVEALRRLGFTRLHETLCVLLDEFAQLDERSYDELYLWCLVELARSDPAYAALYWPQVLALDARYRAAAWQRPAGLTPAEQPYRLSELLFYYYALYSITPHTSDPDLVVRPAREGPLSLGSQIARLVPGLSPEACEIARQSLRALAAETRRPVFGDTLGLLRKMRPAPP